MKRQKRLLVLTGVLAACVVIAFGISRINFEEKMTGEETVIVDVDAADITGLSWNYENEEMEFSKEDDEWVYDKDGKMAVDQDLLSEIAGNEPAKLVIRHLTHIAHSQAQFGHGHSGVRRGPTYIFREGDRILHGADLVGIQVDGGPAKGSYVSGLGLVNV